MIYSKLLRRGAIALAISAGMVAGVTGAAQAADFSGKRVTLIVPTAEGGGTDVYARAMGPFLAEQLPGDPTLVIRNVPGTGSVPGVNQFQREAPSDGTRLLALTTSTFANALLGNPNVTYRLGKFIPIIVSPQGTMVYASPSLGVKGPEDLEALHGKELLYGGYSATSAEIRQLFMFHELGLTIKPVFGLSRGKARQAFQRGETTINNDSAAAYVSRVVPLVERGNAVPMWSTGIMVADGSFVRDPVTPDLPTFTELYEQVHGKPLSGPALEAWHTIASFSVMTNKALVLQGGTPPDVVKAYRDAAAAMLEDERFAEFRKRELGIYPQYVGVDGERPLATASDWTPDGRAYIANFLKTMHDVDL